jgi:hypothetical protein
MTGKKHTPEHIKKFSLSMMGHTHGFKKGFTPWNKDKKGLQIAWNKGKQLPQFSGENNPNWKDGKHMDGQGYVCIYCAYHPYGFKRKYGIAYVYEHRLVMENKLGRYLKPAEEVHHINGIRDDNRLENLMLFPNKSAHRKFHHSLQYPL